MAGPQLVTPSDAVRVKARPRRHTTDAQKIRTLSAAVRRLERDLARIVALIPAPLQERVIGIIAGTHWGTADSRFLPLSPAEQRLVDVHRALSRNEKRLLTELAAALCARVTKGGGSKGAKRAPLPGGGV